MRRALSDIKVGVIIFTEQIALRSSGVTWPRSSMCLCVSAFGYCALFESLIAENDNFCRLGKHFHFLFRFTLTLSLFNCVMTSVFFFFFSSFLVYNFNTSVFVYFPNTSVSFYLTFACFIIKVNVLSFIPLKRCNQCWASDPLPRLICVFYC